VDLQRALNQLKQRDREIIILALIEELQYREIAAMLNIAEGTVKSRLNRAKARLRDFLGEPNVTQ
jgi:RNA polymerase sigma-70 factor (ECF subfamily)